eukprot:scaffold140094_cov15-Tisochrysis_lutea.AAC.1
MVKGLYSSSEFSHVEVSSFSERLRWHQRDQMCDGAHGATWALLRPCIPVLVDDIPVPLLCLWVAEHKAAVGTAEVAPTTVPPEGCMRMPPVLDGDVLVAEHKAAVEAAKAAEAEEGKGEPDEDAPYEVRMRNALLGHFDSRHCTQKGTPRSLNDAFVGAHCGKALRPALMVDDIISQHRWWWNKGRGQGVVKKHMYSMLTAGIIMMVQWSC